MDDFADILDNNARYAERFDLGHLTAPAGKGLAVVMCMDSRLDPLAILGLQPGDAKVIRTAGARVTDDVLRNLVLGVNFLEVDRIAVIPHTGCAMASSTDDAMRRQLAERHPAAGEAVAAFVPGADPDQEAALRADLERVRSCPLIPGTVAVAGFVYDVATGRVTPFG